MRMLTRPRLVELILLCVALVIVTVSWLIVVANTYVTPLDSPKILQHIKWLGPLPILSLIAHLSIRRFCPNADPIFLPGAVLLNGLGLVMVRRLDLSAASNSPVLGERHVLYSLVGLIVFSVALVALNNISVLDRYRYSIGLLSVLLIISPLLPVLGTDLGRGARIWISVGSASLQPGEFAKIGLAIFLSSFLSEKRALLATPVGRFMGIGLPSFRALMPIGLAWGISLLVLVLEKDLGLSLIIFSLFVALLYMATEKIHWVLLGLGLFTGGAYFAWNHFSHVQTRVDIWLDPFADPYGKGWQLAQSLFALASGGIFGTGWGNGSPGWIADAATDIIFSAIGEESGLIGTTAILLIYLLIVMRGFAASLKARDDFSRLLGAGISFVIGIQVFVIVGGVSKLIPLTGITLPFVSYGGSSLIANYIMLALLVSLSASAKTSAYSPNKALNLEVIR